MSKDKEQENIFDEEMVREPNNKINLLKPKKSDQLKMQQPTNFKAKEKEYSRRGSTVDNLQKRIYQEDDFVWVTSSRLITKTRRGCCSSLVDKKSSQEEEMKMIVISHIMGLEESPKHKKKTTKAVGLNGMSDEIFEKEVFELIKNLIM